MLVYMRQEFFTRAECERIRELFPPAQPAAIRDSLNTVVRPTKRRSHASFLSTDTAEKDRLAKRMFGQLVNVNNRFYHYEINGLEPIQLAVYGVGEKYDRHIDLGPGEAGLRKLSASVQLSDENDYDGGDLEIWGCQEKSRAQGSLFIFPSYLVHGVTQVTRGTRYSLVAWAIGQQPFR
jgi:PKHD-type hydroxylase